MDATSTGTVLVVAALLAGVLVGLVAGYFTFPAIREAARLRMQLDQALQDHETYRASVDAHFRKTADLVGQMTRSYANVYDHLATGARAFCDDSAAGSKIPFGPLPGALASPDIEAAAESVTAPPAVDAAPMQAETAAVETTGAGPASAEATGAEALADTAEANAARRDGPQG